LRPHAEQARRAAFGVDHRVSLRSLGALVAHPGDALCAHGWVLGNQRLRVTLLLLSDQYSQSGPGR
jgi:hypothetical protein